MTVSLHIVPVSPREIGDGYRSRPVVKRDFAQRYKAAPLGQIVNVHIQRQSVAQTLYQPVIHDEVHPAVSTYLLGQLFQLFVNRMLVGIH